MKQLIAKRYLPLLAVLCIVLSVAFAPVGLVAAKTSGEIQHIYDEAGLLSTSELANLEELCIEYSKKDDFDIIILTHNDSSAVDGEIYIENFIDKHQYLDSVVLLVDMAKRDVVLESYGEIQDEITTSRGDSIIDQITPPLHNGEYSVAFKKFILSSDNYMNYVPLYFNPLIQLVVALVIGGIVVGVMAYNSGGKMTAGGATYMNPNDSGLIGRRDDYIRTMVTRVRKPQNNGGSGGGGVSAGGLSHTTSRGKF